MKRIFADTGYWIALLNPRDQLHGIAVSMSKQLSLDKTRIVTSEIVLVELLNGFSEGEPSVRRSVAQAVSSLGKNGNVTVVPLTRERFANGVKRYEKAADKAWSLTDCASFQIMEEERIDEALTHDRHFEQAGFRALLR